MAGKTPVSAVRGALLGGLLTVAAWYIMAGVLGFAVIIGLSSFRDYGDRVRPIADFVAIGTNVTGIAIGIVGALVYGISLVLSQNGFDARRHRGRWLGSATILGALGGLASGVRNIGFPESAATAAQFAVSVVLPAVLGFVFARSALRLVFNQPTP